MRILLDFSARSRLPQRLAGIIATVLGQGLGVSAVFVAGVLLLSYVGFHATQPESGNPNGMGIVERTEVLTVWLPRALLELARSEATPDGVHPPDELRALLEMHGLGVCWYALMYRGHQADGRFADITLVCRPGESSAQLSRFQDVMALAVGRPPQGPPMNFAYATIGIIPDRLLTVTPREAVAELIDLNPTLSEETACPISPPDRVGP